MFEIGILNIPSQTITLCLGFLIALSLGVYRAKIYKVHYTTLIYTTICIPLFSFFFSHLGYTLVYLEETLYNHSFGYLFAFWEQGNMFYGSVLGMIIALLFVNKKERANCIIAYTPSIAFVMAILRISEGFLGQGYGEYLYEPSIWARFPFMVYDPYYESWAFALFLLEALILIILFVWALIKKKPNTTHDLLFVIGVYSSMQVVIESLRRDEFLRWGFVRVEQLVSVLLVLVVLICYAVSIPKKKTIQKVICFTIYSCLVILCILLEFATEGRIVFLQFLDISACYSVMAIVSVLLASQVIWMHYKIAKDYTTIKPQI